MTIVPHKAMPILDNGLFRGSISMTHFTGNRKRPKVKKVWDDEAAARMIAIRSRLAILFFTELARPNAKDLNELHSLREELATLEKLRLISTPAQCTQ